MNFRFTWSSFSYLHLNSKPFSPETNLVRQNQHRDLPNGDVPCLRNRFSDQLHAHQVITAHKRFHLPRSCRTEIWFVVGWTLIWESKFFLKTELRVRNKIFMKNKPLSRSACKTPYHMERQFQHLFNCSSEVVPLSG